MGFEKTKEPEGHNLDKKGKQEIKPYRRERDQKSSRTTAERGSKFARKRRNTREQKGEKGVASGGKIGGICPAGV